MNGSVLLDTNIIIALFNRDGMVLRRLVNVESVFIPSIAVGELFFGAYRSTRARRNVTRVQQFADANAILDCDAATAREYGRIKNQLREKGRPIPENDVWISALAQQHALTLISRDRHFEEVENLRSESW